jgi:hypothetical protein
MPYSDSCRIRLAPYPCRFHRPLCISITRLARSTPATVPCWPLPVLYWCNDDHRRGSRTFGPIRRGLKKPGNPFAVTGDMSISYERCWWIRPREWPHFRGFLLPWHSLCIYSTFVRRHQRLGDSKPVPLNARLLHPRKQGNVDRSLSLHRTPGGDPDVTAVDHLA